MRAARAAAALAATFLSLASWGAEPAPNKALNDLFEREFRNEIAEHPELGTLFGVPGFDDRLTDRLPAAVARRKAHAKAKAALGDRFDLRRFHNALLDDGALPLTVLEARIDEWIARELAAVPKT